MKIFWIVTYVKKSQSKEPCKVHENEYYKALKLRVNPGNGLFFQAVTRQVSLLLARFTSVFGMGTGGTMPHDHQGMYPYDCING